ncbi:hypothetical protein JZX76_08275 [Haloarcula hispanica]|uniref:hypothetical protein n=1 Tax=Haloarcula TaxID=2237 RepID=UPI000AE1B999|nr:MULTISPECIES: hypothetical protein [Haloarcula]MCJ0619504.1 hypothetical protein [Haloarcula hispanica]MUV51333.1 hypothetical protein [Haloarcula sp. CBA1122]
MSKTADTQIDDPDDDRLETLYNVHEELQTIAESDVPYAEYAENWLASLREAGYDV